MLKLLLSFTLLQSLLLASFQGFIIDKETQKPIAKATISDSKQSVKSDENGSFSILSQESLYHVKAYGYRPYKINQENNQTLIQVEPINVKALYLSFWGASNNSQTLKNILQTIEETEVNAIVVDIKNEYGSTSYKTSFAQANSYGADEERTNRNIQKFMALMKEKNIYTIARIVTFKDELQQIFP